MTVGGKQTSAQKNRHRDNAGVIATLVHPPSGELRTVHVSGRASEAVLEVCGLCDRLGAEWRVRTLSTPRTIARDLRGSRARMSPWATQRNKGSVTGAHELEPRSEAERILLGTAGRGDLLETPPAWRVMPK